jgi:ubiquinone/menaquinone biosynthesis C-methylase UbiE
MAAQEARFDDGAAYERMMGDWSRRTGALFLDWLAPPPGAKWIDVGCGSGAFAELVVERCAPSDVQGIDPSEAQLVFARKRPAARLATFSLGDAMALPFADDSFDAAVMALVIFFVPDPAKSVAEMVRVVRPGGLVAAYAWDIIGEAAPMEPIHSEILAMKLPIHTAPNPPAAEIEALRKVWTGAGLEAVETRAIMVERTFESFEDYWTTTIDGTLLKTSVAGMTSDQVAQLRERSRARMAIDASGRVKCEARAHAVQGRVA